MISPLKIAVIGARGLLGSALIRDWNRYSTSPDELVPLDQPEFDLAARIFVMDTLLNLRPNVIINTAALNMIDYLETRPNTARTIHQQGVAHLRDAAKKLNALLVQFSCGEVFFRNDCNASPAREEETASPQSVYAQSKKESERIAAECPDHLIIRTSSLFGNEGNGSGNLVSTLLRVVRRTKKIQVIHNTISSPIWVGDLVAPIHDLVQRHVTGTFHLAGHGTASPCQVATALLELQELKQHEIVPVSLEEYGVNAPWSKNTALDTSKYDSLPNVPPLPFWQDSLKNYLRSI